MTPSANPHVVKAEGEGQATQPLVAASAGAPVETAPPNVPEFKPAFAGQTRAPGVKTQRAFRVTEVASELDNPWAVAFLPDGRMLVTEKLEGRLVVLAPNGSKAAVVSGVPKVDGRDQGGLLDVALAPDYREQHRLPQLLRAARRRKWSRRRARAARRWREAEARRAQSHIPDAADARLDEARWRAFGIRAGRHAIRDGG